MPTSALKSRTVWQRIALAVSLSVACAVAQAAPVTFSGSVADCSNPALIGSSPGSPPPSCSSTATIANNVAVYTFIVPFGGFTDFDFGGFSDFAITPFFVNAPQSGGLQTYLSIFNGVGNSAAYVTASAATDLRVFLAAGTYTLAISNLTNHSVAQSTGGTFGQGFTGQGDPTLVGNGNFQLTATVPEPDGAWLAAIGAAALLIRRRQRRGPVRPPVEAA